MAAVFDLLILLDILDVGEDHLMKRNIKASIFQDDGWYVVECGDLNVATQGKTLDEAIVNLKEAISLALEGEDLADWNLVPDPAILVTLELEPLSRAG